MARAWMPGDPGDDELERLFAADREDWRGDEHLADWPEELAGPEYRLFKKWGDRH